MQIDNNIKHASLDKNIYMDPIQCSESQNIFNVSGSLH